MSGCRLNGQKLTEQVIVVHGAGAGGAGVAMAMRKGLERAGLSEAESRRRVLVLDSGGLMVEGRGITGYKAPLVQERADVASWAAAGTVPTLLETVRGAGATVLLGLSGQAGAFDEAVVRAMGANCARPMIFPLSNPTASSEAIPAEVLAWTEGRALVATGSPFEPVTLDGTTHVIGQGNNSFIFPGLGLAAILGYVKSISDEMVMTASQALTAYTAEFHPDLVYPPVSELAQVSLRVATAVLEQALAEGLATIPQRWIDKGALSDIAGYVRSHFWQPAYLPTVLAESPRA